MNPIRMPHENAGYILLYVLGILVFLSVVGLGVAHTMRVNAQLVLNENKNLQDELTLESALHYTLAQLAKTQAVEPTLNASDTSAVAGLWREGGPYPVQVQETQVLVWIEESGLPDINLLTVEQAERLLVALGATPEEASSIAQRLLKVGQYVGNLRGGGGFKDMAQLLALDFIPHHLRHGVAATALEIAKPGLVHWVTVGTGVNTLNPNTTPLPVIGALTAASAISLERLGAMRREKPLTLAEALQILGETARPLLREGPSPVRRILLVIQRDGQERRSEAFVKGGKGTFEVLSYRTLQTALD